MHSISSRRNGFNQLKRFGCSLYNRKRFLDAKTEIIAQSRSGGFEPLISLGQIEQSQFGNA